MLDSKFFFSDFFFFSGLQYELRRELFLCVWGLSKKKKKNYSRLHRLPGVVRVRLAVELEQRVCFVRGRELAGIVSPPL